MKITTSRSAAPERGTSEGTEAVVQSVTSPENLTDIADEDLLLRVAQNGDRAAFKALFHRYAGRIKAFMIKGRVAPDQAEEIAQEVMVSVWRKAASYDPAKAGVATWIFTIARNRRIDVIRRETRPEPDPDDPLYRPDPPEDPQASLARGERDRLVREALAELSDEQREIVRLSFFAGLSHGEIAEQLDVPLGTGNSRIRLAFGRLRTALGDTFSDELND
ncbi:MAG: sigma-70 family RNA polymerase sigma factor [Paracoccaceae bacterium]